MLRELNDYSQDYVGIKLGISQNAYSRIELNQTNLSAEYAQKLAELYGIDVSDLLSKENPIISFINKDTATIDKGYIHNNYEMQKEAIEKIVSAKDDQIKSLNNQIEYLQEQIKELMELLKKK